MPRRDRPVPPDADTAPARWYDRVSWLTVVVSVAIVLSSGVAVLPIHDARTLEAVPEAHLMVPPAYVLVAPLSSVLDTLSLISVQQDIALAAGAFAVLVLWRLVGALRGRASLRGHAIAVVVFIIAVLLAYGAAAVLPRPMASLARDDANLVVIDFHSHTSASHDGRPGWTVAKSRAWHAAAGFDVAYVTDHRTVEAAEQGMATNPVPAAEGVTMLQGVETGWNGEHVALLGAERVYKGILTPDLANVDSAALRLVSLVGGREPIIVWHHPRRLDALAGQTDSNPAGVRAIEITNGDPAVVGRMRRQRPAMDQLADRDNLALTSGTDHHGWGRAAPNWTLMQIPGWRGMAGDALETAIESSLRTGRYGITRVIERTIADPAAPGWKIGLSVLFVPWRMFTTLQNDERVAWLLWIWFIALARWWYRRRIRAAA